MRLAVPRLSLSPGLRRALFALVGIGFLACGAGLVLAPQQAWRGYLIAVYYLAGLGLGSALFLATQYVTGAGWSVAIRRVPEAMTSILPLVGVGFVLLLLGVHSLYPWTHADAHGEPALAGKLGWLNIPFFGARIIGYVVVWTLLSRLVVGTSRRQDQDGDAAHTRANVRNSVFMIVGGVLTGCLAAIDLLMSLQPQWYSTMFGIWSLVGCFLSSIAAMALAVVLLRRHGWDHVFTSNHVYDLGRLLLAFSVFWVYLWASQHMLIWYAHLPEETAYFRRRHVGGWGILSIANVLLNWTLPFLMMLSRDARRSDRVVGLAAGTILLGHWLDLCVVVVPSDPEASPVLGPLELLPAVGALALFVLVATRAFARNPALPIRDPYLVESLPQLTRDAHS
jgi:hypothetical protein